MRVARRLVRFSFLFLAVALACSGTAVAQIALIDLNTDSSGNNLENGDLLRHEFSTMGIQFSAISTDGACNLVRSSDNHTGDFGSPPMLITLCPAGMSSDISEEDFGLIQARFDSTVVGACIGVRPDKPGTDNHYAVMRAYDSAGNLIDEEFSSPGVIETLCVSGERVRRVEFSGAGTKYCRFDDFSVTYGGGPGPQMSYLPASANQPGSGTTLWRTDIEVTNLGTFDMECTVELLEWYLPNPSPKTSTFTVPAKTTTRVSNALNTLFSYTGAATLRVLGLGGSLYASARTYNDDPAGTYGQYIAGLPAGDGITPGRSGVMMMLSQSKNNNTGFRTNLGLVSGSGFPITVQFEIYDADGTLLGAESSLLGAYESIQINKVFKTVTNAKVDDGFIVVWSDSPQALFFAYASVVDNRSGDGIHIPATLR